MKKRFFLIVAALSLISCQLFAPPATPTPPIDPSHRETATVVPQSPTETISVSTPSPDLEPNPALNPLNVDLSRPFYDLPLTHWSGQTYPSDLGSLPVNLGMLANPAVISRLTDDQQALLAQNGFTVLPSQEAQFEDIRSKVADVSGQAYYLTTDAAFHSLHVNFDELLKAIERLHFRPKMMAITQAMFEPVQIYQTQVQGTAIEEDTHLAGAYLAVAMQLFDPAYTPPADLTAEVQAQVAQIMAAAGRDRSSLLPDFEDDYGAYKPVGHYATHPDLESYFRGMTWLGRVAFAFTNPEQPDFVPSRAPLILTLALREALIGENIPAANQWGQVHEALTFLIGPSDDPGPIELSALLDTIYGPGLSITALEDDGLWQTFLQHINELPAPQINSTFVSSTQALEASRDWRLMGQRFTLDGMILQNMVYDKVGTSQKPRELPSGLDVMAAFGSPAALDAQKAAGETEYANYLPQLEKMQSAVNDQPEAQWLARFSTGWLYAFLPQVALKDGDYPPVMRSAAWNARELNSALGSWAELKHDTVLYTKAPEFMGGGGPPASPPAPAYVEPNPEVFYRLAHLSGSLAEGLAMRSLDSVPADAVNEPPALLPMLAGAFRLMSSQFANLGDIASRELQGQSPGEDERYVILECIGLVECDRTVTPEIPPVPVIAVVAGANDRVLETGVGGVDRIYVVAPIDGQLYAAQGGVFSYFEFSQPRSDRLTDEQWRERLAVNAPNRPDFTASYLRSGGAAWDVIVFRVGDWYIITPEGGSPPLNVRSEPSPSAGVTAKLEAGTYITILDGPVQAGGKTWWKIESDFGGANGWVAENPAWYERAHGQ